MSRNFSGRNARRVKQATLRIERQPRNKPPERDYPLTNIRAFCYGYSASGFSAASGSTLGTGSATIQVKSGSSIATSSGITVTCDNAGGAVTGPCYVLLGWAEGKWSVVVATC